MRILIWVLTAIFLLIIQTSILAPLGMGQANLLVVIISLALLSELVQGALVIAIASGLMMDFLSNSTDGLFTLAFLGLWFGMHSIYEGFVKREENRMTFIFSVIGGTILYAILLVLSNWIFSWFGQGERLVWDAFWKNYLGLGIVFNLIFSYPIWISLSGVQALVDRVNKKS